MNPSDVNVLYPPHYKSGKLDVIDFCRHHGICFIAGNVIKYVTRYKKKNGLQDLYKARVFLDRLIAYEEKEAERKPLDYFSAVDGGIVSGDVNTGRITTNINIETKGDGSKIDPSELSEAIKDAGRRFTH